MSNFTDYKFWFILRDNDGWIVKVGVRFYEGDYQIIDGTRTYVRTSKLNFLPHLVAGIVGVDSRGQYARIYTSGDFGRISTDNQLRTYLNGQLALDTTRTPIPEQI